MATLQNFSAMLNQYIPNSLLREALIKRDYFLSNCKKDNNWLGGTLIVPFEGARPSTVKIGGLPSVANIRQGVYVRGEITSQPEAWGSLKFFEKDLIQHGKVNEQSLVKLLPGEIDSLMGYFKNSLSLQFTNGASFMALNVDGTSGGVAGVLRIERAELGANVVIKDNNSNALQGWIGAINVNTNLITLYSDAALTTVLDISAFTVAQAAKIFFDGSESASNQFTSLKASLLSAANGGSTNLYGQAKTAYPYLQSINVNGASWTSTNILEKSLDAMIAVRNKGKGMADKIVCSYTVFGYILAQLQAEKGAFRQASDMKANQYGWTEVNIIGPKGQATFVAIQEMDDTEMFILDMDAITIYSNGFIRKRVGPDGLMFYTIRQTDGYQYIVDICFYGDLVLERPSRCGIVYGLPFPA